MSETCIKGRCAICDAICDGSLMRTHPSYTKTRDMLTAPEVPRMKNGGIALCHHCQRWVYFRGGYLKSILRDLTIETRRAIARQTRSRKEARRTLND